MRIPASSPDAAVSAATTQPEPRLDIHDTPFPAVAAPPSHLLHYSTEFWRNAMGDPVAKAELFDSLARVGKALGSGKRLELLDLLAQGERSVENLATAAGLGLTTCSAHLQT